MGTCSFAATMCFTSAQSGSNDEACSTPCNCGSCRPFPWQQLLQVDVRTTCSGHASAAADVAAEPFGGATHSSNWHNSIAVMAPTTLHSALEPQSALCWGPGTHDALVWPRC